MNQLLGHQIGIAKDIGAHQATVSRNIRDVCNQMLAKCNNWIKFSLTTEELQHAKKIGKRNIIFRVQLIKKALIHGEDYVNRKGLSTINVKATCISKKCVTSVNYSWPGSLHHLRIWKNAELFPIMNENDASAILLADKGYPLTPFQ